MSERSNWATVYIGLGVLGLVVLLCALFVGCTDGPTAPSATRDRRPAQCPNGLVLVHDRTGAHCR